MGQDITQEWLADLAEEAAQYREAYRRALDAEKDSLRRRLLERNMMDKQSQLACLRRLGATERDSVPEEEGEAVSVRVLLYNEIENQSVYAALHSCLGPGEDMEQIRLKQQQIVQRLTAYLIL